MDRLTVIEDNLSSLLKGIDGTLQMSGYQYYTTTGQVEIIDEVLCDELNEQNPLVVNYLIDIDPDEVKTGYTHSQNAYSNQVTYVIKAKVKNMNESTTPKRDIYKVMNAVLSDIKFAIHQSFDLYGNVEFIEYVRSRRVLVENGNAINSGSLLVYLKITYVQLATNPDIPSCAV